MDDMLCEGDRDELITFAEELGKRYALKHATLGPSSKDIQGGGQVQGAQRCMQIQDRGGDEEE